MTWSMFELGRMNRQLKKLYGFGVNDAQLRYYAQSVPGVSDLVRFYEGNKKTTDYMKNRGLSWSDVMYSTNLPSGSLGSSYRSIDKNIDAIAKLYDEPGINDKAERRRMYDEYLRGKNAIYHDWLHGY